METSARRKAPPSEDSAPGRAQCYRCHRPAALCLCPRVPRVEHRTGIFILQHPRERAHPLGTARFATLGLARAHLEVAHGDGRHVAHAMRVPPRTALLYPGGDAPSLADLPAGARPENLLVIDGTWAQSRALLRQNPWIHRLPKVRIEPVRESRYRVRREPRREYVSTLEAIQYALWELEPEVDLGPLVDAFEHMMDAHLARRQQGGVARMRRPRLRRPRAVPHGIVDTPERVAVLYVEPSLADAHPGPRLPVQVCAYRLSDGARFERFVRAHGAVPEPRHLAHMELAAGAFDDACSVDEALSALEGFLGDRLTTGWNQTPADLLRAGGAPEREHVCLKAAYCNVNKRHAGSIESVLAAEGLTPPPLPFAGRAGQRMGNALALLELLRDRGLQIRDRSPQLQG